MRSYLNAVVLTLGLAGLVACGGGDKKPDGDAGGTKKDGGAEKAAAKDYTAADHTGAVKGVLKLDGPAPEGKMLAIAGDDFCMGKHADGMPDPRYVVGEGGVLPNGFVFANKGPHKDYKFTPDMSPSKGMSVKQVGCMYEPHVCGVMVGQEFAVANDDETQHNVHKPHFKKKDTVLLSRLPRVPPYLHGCRTLLTFCRIIISLLLLLFGL